MLKLFNNKIYFDIEVGKNSPTVLTSFPFGPDEKLNEFLPACSIQKQFKISELKDSAISIGLSMQEFYSFVIMWMRNSKFSTFSAWENYEWFDTYLKGLTYFENQHWEHTYDEVFFPEFMRNELHNEDITYKEIKSPIIFDTGDIDPEISLMIEDTFVNFHYNRECRYEKQVNALVQDNIKRMREQGDMLNHFLEKPLISFGIPLDDKITFDKIDYKNPASFLYFYNPVSEERIRSNYLHIQNCCHIMRDIQ